MRVVLPCTWRCSAAALLCMTGRNWDIQFLCSFAMILFAHAAHIKYREITKSMPNSNFCLLNPIINCYGTPSLAPTTDAMWGYRWWDYLTVFSWTVHIKGSLPHMAAYNLEAKIMNVLCKVMLLKKKKAREWEIMRIMIRSYRKKLGKVQNSSPLLLSGYPLLQKIAGTLLILRQQISQK